MHEVIDYDTVGWRLGAVNERIWGEDEPALKLFNTAAKHTYELHISDRALNTKQADRLFASVCKLSKLVAQLESLPNWLTQGKQLERAMFSRTEAPMVLAVVSEAERFSLKHLRKIHQQLVDNKSVTSLNESLVVEILRVLAEMVVYGDNKSELLFDFFCEKNMLSLFLEIMWTEIGCPCRVHVQVITVAVS